MNAKPIIGISMGDPAGIGPEIIAMALSRPNVHEMCRPVVIADPRIMERAADFARVNLKVNRIGKPSEARFHPGAMDVISIPGVDLNEIPIGKVSAAAGDAAFRAIRMLIDLALAHEIDATVTTPIHKEALARAGHHFPGHTEIFAHFTRTSDFTMMLAAGNFRVVHVSTHMSLRDACNAVTKERVLSVIRLGHQACRQLGIAHPRVGVAGLNPHASDGGLFGTEERDHIIPAVDAARASGIDVEGPQPPDTFFAKAVSGAYDICVAMYHDQGHIPVKIRGFQYDPASGRWLSVKGINVSLGMPILRVSVDHGTAFDQAGKGTASDASLLDAIEFASKMASHPVKRILIIADDLTGAAEIGGIAFDHGLTTVIRHETAFQSDADTVIINSDTRQMPDAAAGDRIRQILQSVNPEDFSLIFKKTDSMLRGPVAAELLAAMTSLGLQRALFIPQNPSRNRCIENGQYLINGIPLDRSHVAADIGRFATTSDVRQLLDPTGKFPVRCLPPNQYDETNGITIGAAGSLDEIRQWATRYDARTIHAGGADFFTALVRSPGLSPVLRDPFVTGKSGAIVIFGSACAGSRDYVKKLSAAGAFICDVPSDPAEVSLAREEVLAQLRTSGHAFVAARCPVLPENAERIRQATAELVASILQNVSCNTLFIEGGATASAIVQRLHWATLRVEAQIAPGIVALRPVTAEQLPAVVLKPGTYDWPASLLPGVSREGRA